MSPEEFCRAHGACEDGREFAVQFETMAEVWDKCARLDWAIWILERDGGFIKEQRLFACWCARKALEGVAEVDPRSLAAIAVVERFAVGKASELELEAAGSAAWSAAWSASRSAARSAAKSAAESAAWSAAWSAARSAAEAAGSAARSAAKSAARSAARSAAEAAMSAAWSAARSAAMSAAMSAAEAAQLEQLKRMIPNPFKESA